MVDQDQDKYELNPWLANNGRSANANKGTPATIQDPKNPGNLVWQTRDRIPSDFENALGDALERIFEDGIEGLAEIVERLNRDGPAPNSGEWTEKTFQAEMKRLGG